VITNVSHNAVICILSSTAKLFGVRFGAERRGQGNNFELIPTIKMETRHTVEIYFGRDVSDDLLSLGSSGGLKSSEVENFREIFAIFFGKTTPYDKMFKILFRKFTSRHRSTLLCEKFVKIV